MAARREIRRRDQAKERHWRRLLREWRRSGLSVRDFCDWQALADGLCPGSGWACLAAVVLNSATESVITSLAGFELSEPVVTEVAAFAGGLRPQPPGVRNAIPADLK